MWEFVFIGCILFVILTLFYKQSVSEFRINQIEWSQHDSSSDLLSEKIPLVIRSCPSTNFWTHEDIQIRSCYQQLLIFQKDTVPHWVQESNHLSICPWKWTEAEVIAEASGIRIWANRWMNPVLIPIPRSLWIYPRYSCWAGNKGLFRVYAVWTCLFSMEEEILVTLMPESMEVYLPEKWRNQFPSLWTQKDTPFVSDLKYVDIIVRPGTCLILPPHWFLSWKSNTQKSAMVSLISYHSPMSHMAFNLSKN